MDALSIVIGVALTAIAVVRLIVKFGPLRWSFPRLMRLVQLCGRKVVEVRELLGQSV